MQLTFSLPIYYTVIRKTKPNSTHLVSDNWVRNLHYQTKNKVKQHYHKLIASILTKPYPLFNKFSFHCEIYYKSTNCDASNIAHQIEKMALDGLGELGIIINDNVKFHLKSSWVVAGQSKNNPCCIVTIKELP